MFRAILRRAPALLSVGAVRSRALAVAAGSPPLTRAMKMLTMTPTPLKLTGFGEIHSLATPLVLYRTAYSRPSVTSRRRVQDVERGTPLSATASSLPSHPGHAAGSDGVVKSGATDAAPAVTAWAEVQKNTRLARFLQRVYGGAATGVLVTGSTAWLLSGWAAAHPFMSILGGFGVAMYSLYRIVKVPPVPVAPGITKNPPARKRASMLFYAAEGAVVAPLVAMAIHMAPGTLLPAFLLSAGSIVGSSLWAMTRPTGSLLSWGAPLTGGLLGLIGVALVGIIWPTPMLVTAISAASVGLFTAFNAYDTHQAIDDFKNGNADHLIHSVNFFLNFTNLFTNFLRLLNLDSGLPAGAGNPHEPISGADINTIDTDAATAAAEGVDLSGLSDEALESAGDGMLDGVVDVVADAVSTVKDVVSGITDSS